MGYCVVMETTKTIVWLPLVKEVVHLKRDNPKMSEGKMLPDHKQFKDVIFLKAAIKHRTSSSGRFVHPKEDLMVLTS